MNHVKIMKTRKRKTRLGGKRGPPRAPYKYRLDYYTCVNTGGCSFWQLAKFTKRNRRHDALQAAHVQKVSVCVTFGACWLGHCFWHFAAHSNRMVCCSLALRAFRMVKKNIALSTNIIDGKYKNFFLLSNKSTIY